MEKARNHRTREIAGKIWRGIVWVWRHPVIPITALLVVLTATCYKDARQRRGLKTEIDALKDTVEAMSGVIDSLECIHVLEDKVTKKAGELAIRPHGEGKKLTEENVAKLLTELDAWFPDIKMAQYQHESGFGVSKVARNANNISGKRRVQRIRKIQRLGVVCNRPCPMGLCGFRLPQTDKAGIHRETQQDIQRTRRLRRNNGEVKPTIQKIF